MTNINKQEQDFQALMDLASKMGAYKAKVISPSIISVEDRAQLRCLIPRCTSYGRSLTCPPNVPSADKVRKLVSEYRYAMMVQVKGTEEEDGATEEMKKDYNWVYPSVYKLHYLIHELEKTAFDQGYYFAMGLGGGDCRWCELLSNKKNVTEELHANAGGCAGSTGGNCNKHYRARPALEAMSINVIKTAENAGLPFYFSGKDERYVVWNGIVLID